MPETAKEFTYYDVMPIENLPAGKRVVITFNKQSILIVNVGGEFFAVGNECTHDDGALNDGDVENCTIVCPRHGAAFDLRSGKALTLPAVLPVPTYPIRTTNGKIEIGIPIE